MSIADRAVRTNAGPVDLVVLPTGIRDVVTLRGSLDTWPDFTGDGEMVQALMARCLDKGTTTRGKFEVAEALENLGAHMGFSGSAARITYSARALSKDLEAVVGLLFEQLITPALEDSELAKERDRMQASIQRGTTEAGYRADAALSQHVYATGHPNVILDPEAEEKLLTNASFDSVRASHRESVLAGTPRLVLVGDLDVAECLGIVAKAAEAWAPEDSIAGAPPASKSPTKGALEVEIADRDNLEVRWGHSLPLSRLHDDYLATYMASFILGGNFSARLMNEVRDKQGLTYGIGSGIRGMDARYTGMWSVNVTLSQENLERGIASTEEVLKAFATGGVTADELAEKKDTISGSFQVRQATTGGLAGSLLQQLEDGRELAFVDTFPDRIRSLTLAQVNEAVRAYFHPDSLCRVVAGTIPTSLTA
jgi:zinc protease